MLSRRALLLFVIFGLTLTYGMVAGRYRLFPFTLAAQIKPHLDQILPSQWLERPDAGPAPINRPERLALFDLAQGPVDIVFLGDSLIEGGLWSELLPDHRIANRGVGGDTLPDVLKRLDQVKRLEPSQIVVTIGINDIHRGTTPPALLAQYRDLLAELTAISPSIVVLSTIQCLAKVCGEKIKDVNTVNQLLPELVQSTDASFVSLGQLSAPTGLAPDLTYDGLHLTSKGYSLLMQTLRPHLVAPGQ